MMESHHTAAAMLLRSKQAAVGTTTNHLAGGISHFRDLPAFGLLQHAAKHIGDRTAVNYGSQRWTYQQLNECSIRCAALLQSMGVRPGDRVGILLPNVPEYMIAANAIWRAGGVTVAISPLMVAEEVDALLRATGCRLVIGLDVLAHLVHPDGTDQTNPQAQLLLVSIRKHLPALAQLGYLWARHQRTGHWTLPSGPHCGWFWNEVERVSRKWQPISIDASTTPAHIIPTGGTTGAPKAVVLSHQGMVANAWQQYQWTGGSFGTETMMAVLPLFHSYGMSTTAMAGVAMGATLVMHHRFNVRQTIRMIETHRPTVFHAVPAMLVAMNDRLRAHPARLDSLRWVISGGAPLDEEVGREFAKHTGALVVEGYGLSEASPVTHVGPLFDEASYGTIGLPLPLTECRIVDAVTEDQDVAAGQVGELLVRGPQLMLGYWNDPQATAEVLRGGWLHTGDLAQQLPGGRHRIVGRKKDLIITSGFNVYPAEVEAVISQLVGVKEVAVIAQPDPARGEVVKAFVVLESNQRWDEQRLRDHCKQHLAKHKQPRIYEQHHGELPKNFLGKIIRRQLREQAPANAQSLEVTS